MPVLWEETIRGGAMWSHVLKRGTALRIADTEGGANVGALFYNFENPLERYNMADTLKAQHIARLTTGCVLYSDMGRILCSITADTCGWHDPIGGTSNARLAKARYGEGSYQELRNDCLKNGRDAFLVELAKYGLGPRDLVPNVNFFSKVAVTDTGEMKFVPGNSKPGDYVELRVEMNTLAILNTCPHPLDPAPAWNPRPEKLTIHTVPPPAENDACRTSRPENGRGFTLTERYFL
jgi:urea carboxylase-associated protein 2